MSLKEYERKRKFSETPEPKPLEAKHGGWRFVVQKHRATQLHYDFRLELDGVLKSWAVPKGPSLDPAEKRLAMHVEDHPVEYIAFEGRIPGGNYGAGAVMVWDEGTWIPYATEKMTSEQRAVEARAMLAKGDLKFELAGHKLRGSFVLAKMKSRRPGSKGTEWLLIKHRDDAVQAGYDIDAHDGSVLSGRLMDEIADDKKSAEWGKAHPETKTEIVRDKRGVPKAKVRHVAIDWTKEIENVKGACKAAMPKVVKPMLASLGSGLTKGAEWLYEIKWDGYRALAYVEDGRARLVSRSQNDLTEAFGEVAAELPGRVRAKSALLDGEIVALDDKGRSSFSLMQQRTGVGKNPRSLKAAAHTEVPIVFYAFDLLQVDEWSLMGAALEDRKRLLREALNADARVRYSESFDDGTTLLAAAKEQGLEGIVAKRRDSRYEQKRSGAWCKVKITQTEECVIGGWTDPRGGREYFGSLVLGLYEKNGKLRSVGQAGTGFTRETEAQIFKLLQERETKKNPFANKVETGRGIHYVKPDLVAQIKFTEWTHEGQKGGLKMRAPVFLGLRVDKSAEECKAA